MASTVIASMATVATSNAAIFDTSFTAAEGFQTPTYTVGSVPENDWNSTGSAWQIDATSGIMSSINARGSAMYRGPGANPLVGVPLTLTIDLTFDIEPLGNNADMTFGITDGVNMDSTIGPTLVIARMQYKTAGNGGWNLEAASKTSPFTYVDNSDLGINVGASDFVSDPLRIEWTAVRLATDGSWDLSMSLTNLTTSTTFSTGAPFTISGAIPLSEDNAAAGIRTFGPTAGWDGTVMIDRMAMVPEPSTYALLFGLASIGMLMLRRRFSTTR
jgi:hypothetical protein